jgi:hypothetical protein
MRIGFVGFKVKQNFTGGRASGANVPKQSLGTRRWVRGSYLSVNPEPGTLNGKTSQGFAAA